MRSNLPFGLIDLSVADRVEVAKTATAATAPTIVTLLGYDVPVLSALVGIAAVVVARLLARQHTSQVKPLPLSYEVALNILLSLLIVAIVIDDHKSPLIALGFGIGLGYAGISIIEAIASKFAPSVPGAFDKASIPSAARAAPLEDDAQ